MSSTQSTAFEVLKATSRTFYIPVMELPDVLKEAVAAAYLCLRAIDEVEDHCTLSKDWKIKILTGISNTIQAADPYSTTIDFQFNWHGQQDELEEVTLRLNEWLCFARNDVCPRIWESTATMALRMAQWVERDFYIADEGDLNAYTFSVAGSVGLLLADLWQWHDDTRTDRRLAVGFGRALQSVNIIRNYKEDMDERNVNFFPPNWTPADMDAYARRHLNLAQEYIDSIENPKIKVFCSIPKRLALMSLNVIKAGGEKLSRTEVKEIVTEVKKDVA